jgi:hypothetical protein
MDIMEEYQISRAVVAGNTCQIFLQIVKDREIISLRRELFFPS